MNERDLVLTIQVAIDGARQQLNEFHRRTKQVANQIKQIWQATTKSIQTAWNAVGKAFDATIGRMIRGLRRLSGVAQKVGGAVFSLPGAIVGGAVGFGTGALIERSFESQLTNIRLRTLNPNSSVRIRNFVDRQTGGFFGRNDILQALEILTRAGLQPSQAFRILSNRGVRGITAGTNETLTQFSTDLTGAIFRGEADPAEKFGLNLKIGTIAGSQAAKDVAARSGREFKNLTDREKALVGADEALRQLTRFGQLESEILKINVGTWRQIKNTIDEIVLTLGKSLQPTLTAILENLRRLLDEGTFKRFGQNLVPLMKAIGMDMGSALVFGINQAVQFGLSLISELGRQVSKPGQLLMRVAGFGKSLGELGVDAAKNVGGAATDIVKTGLLPPDQFKFFGRTGKIFNEDILGPKETSTVPPELKGALSLSIPGRTTSVPIPSPLGIGEHSQRNLLQALNQGADQSAQGVNRLATSLSGNLVSSLGQVASVVDSTALQVTSVLGNMAVQIVSLIQGLEGQKNAAFLGTLGGVGILLGGIAGIASATSGPPERNESNFRPAARAGR